MKYMDKCKIYFTFRPIICKVRLYDNPFFLVKTIITAFALKFKSLTNYSLEKQKSLSGTHFKLNTGKTLFKLNILMCI
jgi:hypothetical protein